MAKYNDFKILCGEDLKKVRLLYKMKQKDMAMFFGVARSTYAVWETKYKNKLLPINKYRETFEIVEYWMPKKIEKETVESFDKMTFWQKTKWFIRTLLFME